jgi:hypothetical protein
MNQQPQGTESAAESPTAPTVTLLPNVLSGSLSTRNENPA